MKKARIAVIGAGLSGLACAYELTKAGQDVVVYEKAGRVAGRSLTRRDGLYPFDTGAQFLNNGYSQCRAYCKELGISNLWRTMDVSTHHLYKNGKLHCISFKSIGEFLGLSFYSTLARVRLLMCYLRLQRDAKGIDLYDLSKANTKFDQISARDYILKWGGQEVLDYAFDSLIATYHFHGAHDLSLSCLLGAISAIGKDFSYDYFEGGLDMLAQALAKKVLVNCGREVQKVVPGLGGIIVEEARSKEVFDHVVIATTASVAKSILKGASPDQKQLLDAVNYSSTVTAAFRVPSAAVSNLAMVAVPASQNQNICCYFNQNSKYVDLLSGEYTLINVFLRDECAKEWISAPDEQLWEFIKAELIEVCPPLKSCVGKVEPYDLQRWPEAIPKYSVGFVSHAGRFWQEGQGDNNVFMCGDYLNAPWMEGSTRCGKKVAESVLASITVNK
ncbi:MAG: NAD(P)/FAD-dependent oxidoreductase [Chlamydiales bacterium]|nr:NAD(P)/FAD-dependent oxidoreductase [Chlamydiales bacterium]